MVKNKFKVIILIIIIIIGGFFLKKVLSLPQLGGIAGGVSIVIGVLFLGTKIIFPDVFWSLHHKILKNIKLGDYIIVYNAKLGNPEGFIIEMGVRTIKIKNQLGIISLPFSHLSGRVTVTPYNLRLDFLHSINANEKEILLKRIRTLTKDRKIRFFITTTGFSLWIETNHNEKFKIQNQILEVINTFIKNKFDNKKIFIMT